MGTRPELSALVLSGKEGSKGESAACRLLSKAFARKSVQTEHFTFKTIHRWQVHAQTVHANSDHGFTCIPIAIYNIWLDPFAFVVINVLLV